MALVTPAEVSPLVPGIPLENLEPFISTADLVVSESLSNKGLTPARLKEIERYLSAHYATVSYGETTMEKQGDAQQSFSKATAGRGFLETALGRQAVALDTTGTLSSLGDNPASFELLT